MTNQTERTEPSAATAPRNDSGFFLVFFGIFLCMGLLFFILGLRELYQQSEFKRRSSEAIGVVSNYFGSMEILVTYSTATGAEIYAMPKNVHLSRPAIGSRIRLWYNPEQPLEVVAQGGVPSFMLGGSLALLIFGGVGATGFYYVWRSRQLRFWLYAHGQRIEAAFVRSYWIGWRLGKSIYWVRAEWTDPSTGEIYPFYGFLNGTTLLRQLKDKQFVAVLIDPDDPRRYDMELPE